MHIIVCIKQVPDPEGPPDSYVINEALQRVDVKGIPPVLSLFDENALEAALRIRDRAVTGEVKITVLSMGKRISAAVLQKALAAGADELVKVEDASFEAASHDSHAVASTLAAAVRKMGAFDLILCGRQAADWNMGQAGIGVAHALRLPVITGARKITVEAGHAVVERTMPSGYEVVRAPLPAVVVAGGDAGVLRYPTVIQRRDAKTKPVVSWGAADIGMEGGIETRLKLRRLFSPPSRRRQCIVIGGATAAEAGRTMAERLTKDGIL